MFSRERSIVHGAKTLFLFSSLSPSNERRPALLRILGTAGFPGHRLVAGDILNASIAMNYALSAAHAGTNYLKTNIDPFRRSAADHTFIYLTLGG